MFPRIKRNSVPARRSSLKLVGWFAPFTHASPHVACRPSSLNRRGLPRTCRIGIRPGRWSWPSCISGTINTFVLHGNVHDLVRSVDAEQKDTFVNLSDFLATQLFRVVGCGARLRSRSRLKTARGRRLETAARDGAVIDRHDRRGEHLEPRSRQVLDQLDAVIQRNLLDEQPNNRQRVGDVVRAWPISAADRQSRHARSRPSCAVGAVPGWARIRTSNDSTSHSV